MLAIPTAVSPLTERPNDVDTPIRKAVFDEIIGMKDEQEKRWLLNEHRRKGGDNMIDAEYARTYAELVLKLMPEVAKEISEERRNTARAARDTLNEAVKIPE